MRTIGGGGELTAGCEAIGHETLEENRTEVGTTKVDGGGVSCWARADNHLYRSLISTPYEVETTTWERY